MGEMADYYTNEGIGTDEELEAMTEGKDLRIFVVTYPNGNLHSTTTNQEIAYNTADRINGIIGELVNVHRPLKEEDIPEPARSAIIHALEHPENRIKRERPKAA